MPGIIQKLSVNKKLIYFLLLILLAHNTYADNSYLLNNLCRYIPLAREYLPLLQPLAEPTTDHTINYQELFGLELATLPLYQHYPHLISVLPRVRLSDLPTPIKCLSTLSNVLQIDLYLKCDDVTGILFEDGTHDYGGNKIRKLEFLLADALYYNAKTIMTFGCVGSNHAAATALSARRLGFKSISMLKPQPNSQVVRKNLQLMHTYGSHMHLYANNKERERGVIPLTVLYRYKDGKFPYVIPTGGSCPLGVVGFVNAALELKEQIDTQVVPEPDYIYLACGSKGTVAGLLVGIKAAGLKTKVMAVCIEPENMHTFPRSVYALATETNQLLHSLDKAFPLLQFNDDDVSFIFDCCGKQYGIFTAQAVDAIKLVKEYENIQLDGTYTGKAFAALIRDANQGLLKDKKVLFWNTYCNHTPIKNFDYKNLPQSFHQFFEQEVQPLDIR